MKSFASTVTDANDTAHVTIMTGATITGASSVDIEARHDDIFACANAHSTFGAIGGEADAATYQTITGPNVYDPSEPSFSQVDAAPGAAI